ncbi:MAG: bifunctional phosphopantothenoylcysteine decarboxylase/phosphopantothenate--cysteine ligase CoaBC [Fibrobacterota bacterium]
MGAGPQNVLIGVTGGIAAYKIPVLIRLLIRSGCEVKVVMTETATRLVSLDTIRTLSHNPVYTDIVSRDYDMGHIALRDWADVFLIAPATANTIGKLACFLGDNLLTTLALAHKGPFLIAPAMNSAMWSNPGVRNNLALLQHHGYCVLPVGSGELACGDTGAGRMIEPEEIISYLQFSHCVKTPFLSGKRILITSGPTQEFIDPVRYITNRSSGKMGAALARAALLLGAEVTFITGPAREKPPAGCRVLPVTSAADMLTAVDKNLEQQDVCIMAAAVGDFSVQNRASTKMSRRDGEKDPVLKLQQNTDIAAYVGRKKDPHTVLITFSLENTEDMNRVRKKMAAKNADMAVLNTIARGLDSQNTSIHIVSSTHNECVSHINVSKEYAAFEILSAGRNERN